MRLNDLKPAVGAKRAKVRLGRGMGSGLGKTCGFGHKGQKARSGCSCRAGFEGGQTPLYRRLPKFGFHSRRERFNVQLSLTELSNSGLDTIDMTQLVSAGLIPARTQKVQVVLSGSINRAVVVGGDIGLTVGARAAIEAAGGKVQECERCCGHRCAASD